MLLYKYASLDRLDVLVNYSIRFTPIAEFNDPFEAPIPYLDNEAERTSLRLVDRILASFIQSAKTVEEAARNAKALADKHVADYLIELINSKVKECLSKKQQKRINDSTEWRKLIRVLENANIHSKEWGEDVAESLLAVNALLKNLEYKDIGILQLFSLIPCPYINIDSIDFELDDEKLKELMAEQKITSDFAYISTKDLLRLVSHLGVLSLSSDPKNLLMWAHYGEQHKGVVLGIEFDIDRPSATFCREENDAVMAIDLRPVRYATHRPIRHLDSYNAIDYLFTKSVEWRYENEWRAAALLSGADNVVGKGEQPIHLFKINSTSLRSITFGSRVTDSVMVEACKRAGVSPDTLCNIVVKRLNVDPLEFKLKEENIDLVEMLKT